MGIQKINVGGVDVEIEDISARTNITNLENKSTTQIKNIIQTLSKQIPNSDDDVNKHYLDEFNSINSIDKAIELLNKRLEAIVPKERIIKYNPYKYNGEYDVQYIKNDGSGNVSTRSQEISVVLQSLYMDWNKEYDTTGSYFQYRNAFIPYGYLNFKTNNTKINTNSGEYNNSLFLGNIDEGDTYNYTDFNGYLPCNVYTDTARTTGLLYFYEQGLYLYCDNWSWLGNEDTIINVNFNGNLRYRSYEDYTVAT